MKKTLVLLLVAVGITAGSSYSAQKQETENVETLTTSIYIVTDNKEDDYIEAQAIDRALEDYSVLLPDDGKYKENETLRIGVDGNGDITKIERIQSTNF
jgi:hypothetical protein